MQLDLFAGKFDEKIEAPQKKPPRRKREEQYVFDLTDALTSPVIAFPSPWMNDIPEQILEVITLARMAALMKHEEMATIPEAVAYLMPRSFEAPMGGEWTNIYLFVCRQYLLDYRSADSEPLDFAPAELDEYERSLLLKLRRWIWEKRRKALKDRNRVKRSTQKSVEREDTGQQDLTLIAAG